MSIPTSFTEREMHSQPQLWRAMDERVDDGRTLLGSGRSLVLGCGTSAFVAQAVATLREQAGIGATDWCYGSEPPTDRRYDHVLAISRSATTTEVLDLLRTGAHGTRRAGVSAVGGQIARPFADLVDDHVVLGEADEQSVVQTRFPTTLLTLVRAALGAHTGALADEAERALELALPDPADFDQFVFLGRGWCVGLAHEAALKMREMALAWSESYPALDYRHGPIALAGPRTLVSTFGAAPPSLISDIAASGATVLAPQLDPLAQLVVAQRLALAAAHAKGLDPDHPHGLVRSVVLND